MSKGAFEPCIPTRGTTVPTGEDWLHEIKHDGYRLIVQTDGQRVHLFTRNGHDWSGRFPLITEAALRNQNSSFALDGEAVLRLRHRMPGAEGHAMPQQRTKRIPTWLTIDLLVIVVSLVIIGIGMWIAPW